MIFFVFKYVLNNKSGFVKYPDKKSFKVVKKVISYMTGL